MPLDLTIGEEHVQEGVAEQVKPVSTNRPERDEDLSLLLSFVKFKKG